MKKADLRKKILLNRSTVHTMGVHRLIQQHLQTFLLTTQAKVLGFYWPIRNEIDIVPIARVNCNSFQWVLPKIKQSHMGFYDWNSEEKLLVDDFGVPSPSFGKEIVPDVIFVPCLAMDYHGHRLGYGQGWYDRYLCQYPSIYTVGIVASEFLYPSLPSEKHDIVLNALVTENGFKIIHHADDAI